MFLCAGNGTVDFYEFARMVSQKMKDYDPEKELKEAFAVFDKNGDGKVSSEEITSQSLAQYPGIYLLKQ